MEDESSGSVNTGGKPVDADGEGYDQAASKLYGDLGTRAAPFAVKWVGALLYVMQDAREAGPTGLGVEDEVEVRLHS